MLLLRLQQYSIVRPTRADLFKTGCCNSHTSPGPNFFFIFYLSTPVNPAHQYYTHLLSWFFSKHSKIYLAPQQLYQYAYKLLKKKTPILTIFKVMPIQHSPIAHQFQLALVACAKTHTNVGGFFGKVNMVVNLIWSSNFGCYNYF